MKKWLKRIRGAVGLGLSWAVAWAGIFGIASMIGGEGGGLENLLANLATFGALGFVGGTVFSVVLGIAERRRTFAEMSLRRFAAWGGGRGWSPDDTSLPRGDARHTRKCHNSWRPGTTRCRLRRWFTGAGPKGRRQRVARAWCRRCRHRADRRGEARVARGVGEAACVCVL